MTTKELLAHDLWAHNEAVMDLRDGIDPAPGKLIEDAPKMATVHATMNAWRIGHCVECGDHSERKNDRCFDCQELEP